MLCVARFSNGGHVWQAQRCTYLPKGCKRMPLHVALVRNLCTDPPELASLAVPGLRAV
jgi:hypothetical protein